MRAPYSYFRLYNKYDLKAPHAAGSPCCLGRWQNKPEAQATTWHVLTPAALSTHGEPSELQVTRVFVVEDYYGLLRLTTRSLAEGAQLGL